MSCPKRAAVAGVPDDAMVEILSRLPVKPLHRSKCVAKAWRDLVDGPHHRKKLPQTLEGFLVVDGAIYGAGGSGSGSEESDEEVYCGFGRRGFRGGGGGDDGGRIRFISLRSKSSSVPLGVDACLSFLTKLPEIKTLTFADSCNGLLLFEHGRNSIRLICWATSSATPPRSSGRPCRDTALHLRCIFDLKQGIPICW
ncbi:hypothetical protein ACP4OV_012245 [Aristida adscensionis]